MQRSRTTLPDQLSTTKPAGLRNHLIVNGEDRASAGRAGGDPPVTLASFLESERCAGRTLHEVFREDASSSGGSWTSPEREERRPMRVSLMTLMQVAERAGGGVGPAADEEAASAEAEEKMLCGVCVVRRKGAAFIPCGHTFCRVCSRDLFTGRGSCPACKGVIFDILDIF